MVGDPKSAAVAVEGNVSERVGDAFNALEEWCSVGDAIGEDCL